MCRVPLWLIYIYLLSEVALSALRSPARATGRILFALPISGRGRLRAQSVFLQLTMRKKPDSPYRKAVDPDRHKAVRFTREEWRFRAAPMLHCSSGILWFLTD